MTTQRERTLKNIEKYPPTPPPTGHTPAPWQANMDNKFEVFNVDGNAIAQVYRLHNNGRFEADARLIVAAPDLLETLQKIELLMTKCERDRLENWADFGARVYLLTHETRAAIAKATN